MIKTLNPTTKVDLYRPAYNVSVFAPADTPPVACINHGDFTIPA